MSSLHFTRPAVFECCDLFCCNHSDNLSPVVLNYMHNTIPDPSFFGKWLCPSCLKIGTVFTPQDREHIRRARKLMNLHPVRQEDIP